MKKFSGLITALATPFINGELDVTIFKKLIKFQLENGIDGFVINGTTGESPTLTTEEVMRLLEIAKSEVPEDFPMILGTGSNSTSKTVEATKLAKEWGADAALVVVPYYNKPTQEGLFKHFKMVAESVDIPILLYNVPGRTITALSVETIAELSKIPNIIGIKEASGDVAFAKEIRKAVGESFLITSGDDQSCVELCSEVGDGCISVISHLIPAELKKFLVEAKENKSRSSEFVENYGGLLDAVYAESNPIGVKRALSIMEIFDSAELRLPMVEMSGAATDQLKNQLMKLGLVK